MPPRHTIVKVCGLTRLEDARLALEAGADWLGFVVYGESPRSIDAGRAGEIVQALPPVPAVAVMVAPSPDQALAIARRTHASRVQLHRVDPATWPADYPLPVTFAVSVAVDGTLTGPLPGPDHLLLLDTAHARKAGGTGRSFPWEAARTLAAGRAIMMAGGLDGDNVPDAIEQVHPYGVDASSRLEREPGIKDPDKVRRFVAAARTTDERIDGVA